MARSTKKSNPTQEIADALDTPIDLDWQETADTLGLSIPQLQERMASRLGDIVFAWELIPTEHQPVIEAIARDLESEKSVRRLEATTETPIPTPEPPIVEESADAPKATSKRSKAKSGAITKTRKSSLEKGAKSSQKATDLEQIATATLASQKGIRKGANLAAIELTAQEASYQHVKKEGLKRQIAKLAKELEDEKNFDPQEMLAALGIPGLEETETELNDLIEGTLGKLGNATEEILHNAWMNGLDMDAELENLQALLNLNA